VVLSEASTDDDVVGGEVVEEPVTFQERLRLFRRLALPYFQQAEGAKLNFGLMLLLVLINSAVSVTFSYVGRDFYSALSAKDQALFSKRRPTLRSASQWRRRSPSSTSSSASALRSTGGCG